MAPQARHPGVEPPHAPQRPQRKYAGAARPWDLVVLDEAHHARRRAPAAPPRTGRPAPAADAAASDRTKGLVLLTATPMQVHPVEVGICSTLLGLPPEWTARRSSGFFEIARREPNPLARGVRRVGRAVPRVERRVRPLRPVEVPQLSAGAAEAAPPSGARTRCEIARNIPRRQSRARPPGRAIMRMLRQSTPISRLVSRHTRELLRAYYQAGKIDTPIPQRAVEDRFVEMTPEEWAVYRAVEAYVSTTYDRAPRRSGAPSGSS